MIKGQIDAILWHRIKKNKFSRGLIPITRAQSIYSPKNHIGKVFEKIRFLQMCSTDQSVQPLKAGEMMMHFGLIDIRVFHFYFYISSKKPNLKHIYRITFLSRCRYNFCIIYYHHHNHISVAGSTTIIRIKDTFLYQTMQKSNVFIVGKDHALKSPRLAHFSDNSVVSS